MASLLVISGSNVMPMEKTRQPQKASRTMAAPSGIGAVLRIMQHTGQYGVDVKIQRFYAGANHVAQWPPDGIMHLTEHHRGPGYGVAPVCAQPFKQFYQVAA